MSDPTPRLTHRYRLCVGIQKGGIGKTTTAVNLAECLTRQIGEHEKVLLIDMDPQRSSSKLMLGISDGIAPTVRELLLDPGKQVADVVHRTSVPRLFIIPSSLKLAPVESILTVPGEYDSPIFQLYSKLTPEAISPYRFVVIDTPPSMGQLMMNALAASDYLIAPMESGSGFSFDGIDDLLKLVTLVKKEQNKHLPIPFHADLQLLGVLLTKHDRRQILCKTVHGELLDKYRDDVFTTTIPMASAAVKKAEIALKTLRQSDLKSTVARQYLELAEEVIARIMARETAQPVTPAETREPSLVGEG